MVKLSFDSERPRMNYVRRFQLAAENEVFATFFLSCSVYIESFSMV